MSCVIGDGCECSIGAWLCCWWPPCTRCCTKALADLRLQPGVRCLLSSTSGAFLRTFKRSCLPLTASDQVLLTVCRFAPLSGWRLSTFHHRACLIPEHALRVFFYE